MTANLIAARGRTAAYRLMTDMCEIREPSLVVFNPATKANDETSGALVYAGRCRVRPRDGRDQEDEVGDSPVSTWQYMLSIPFGATLAGVPVLPRPDQLVTVTASIDPTLVGQRMRIRQVVQGPHITARRMQVEVYGG